MYLCISEAMPVSRMRMRPWLEREIDSNAIDGLSWVDKVCIITYHNRVHFSVIKIIT